MAQVVFTEVEFHSGLIQIQARYNDANNRVNRLIIVNNHPTATCHAEAERKDDPTIFYQIDVGPETTQTLPIAAVHGVTVGFDPEDGAPNACYGNYIVRASA